MTTLGELAALGQVTLQTGPFGSQLHASDYLESGVPVVPTEAIGRRRLLVEGLPRVSEQTAARLERHKLRVGDILFARRGIQATGLSALVETRSAGWLCGTGAILLRVSSSSVYPPFLSFALTTDESIAWLKANAVGAVMPNLNTGIIARLPIRLPAPEQQRRIASILGALDDKIELNRQTNETLEAMARALFKSWFVDFDPVRAKMEGRAPAGMDAETAKLFPNKLNQTPLGAAPDGWTPCILGDVLGRLTDGAHASPASVETGGMPMGSVKDMTPWGIDITSCRRISQQDFDSLVALGCQPQRGDVLLAKDGARCLETVCEFDQPEALVLLSSVAILRPSDPSASSYLNIWLSLESTKTYLKEGFVSGSAIPRVVLKDLRRAQLLFPTPAVLSRFDDLVRRPRTLLRQRESESRTLAGLRDALLPKLMSGELRDSDAERIAEARL